MHATQVYSLPIPTGLTAFALALPPVTGLSIEAATSLTRKGAPRRDALALGGSQSGSSMPLTLTLAVLVVYETVVATLAGTYIGPPQTLVCGLQDKWEKLYRGRAEATVRGIQDRFNCCGFRKTTHMAWPFQGINGADSHSCENTFGRTIGCLGSLRSEEQKVAGMLIAVAVGVFLWKVGFDLRLSPSAVLVC